MGANSYYKIIIWLSTSKDCHVAWRAFKYSFYIIKLSNKFQFQGKVYTPSLQEPTRQMGANAFATPLKALSRTWRVSRIAKTFGEIFLTIIVLNEYIFLLAYIIPTWNWNLFNYLII